MLNLVEILLFLASLANSLAKGFIRELFYSQIWKVKRITFSMLQSAKLCSYVNIAPFFWCGNYGYSWLNIYFFLYPGQHNGPIWLFFQAGLMSPYSSACNVIKTHGFFCRFCAFVFHTNGGKSCVYWETGPATSVCWLMFICFTHTEVLLFCLVTQ